MLLNYLFANFQEERDFASAANLSAEALGDLIEARLMPSASYVVDGEARSLSFVSRYRDDAVYRFHLKGHLEWIEALSRLSLGSEARARDYFEHRYHLAKATFLSGDLGRDLAALLPEVPEGFDSRRAEATWDRFLKGVYGVCTRDGRPETIFLKQAGVDFIERLTASGPADLTGEELRLLARAVDFLDRVESDFAPHEVAQASRQRCIIDVRARFLSDLAA